MKGIPTYTQHSVAWPTQALCDRALDEVGISFEAKGGGTHGEFRFVWVDLDSGQAHDSWLPPAPVRYPNGALQIQAFADGFSALLDSRIVGVLDYLKRLPDRNRDITPARLIELLERAGVRASTHHLRGLHESTWGRPESWPDEPRKAYDRLKKHEAWA